MADWTCARACDAEGLAGGNCIYFSSSPICSSSSSFFFSLVYSIHTAIPLAFAFVYASLSHVRLDTPFAMQGTGVMVSTRACVDPGSGPSPLLGICLYINFDALRIFLSSLCLSYLLNQYVLLTPLT